MGSYINTGQSTIFQSKMSSNLSQGVSAKVSGLSATYGRVLDVVLDDTHPFWENLGCSQAQYGVFYQKLYDESNNSELSSYNFAYCYNSNFRRLPIRNEIVALVSSFSSDKSNDTDTVSGEKVYWTDIVPVWNLPFLNEYPVSEEAIDFGKFFLDEPEGTNPLQLCPGDISVEGRHGQSIRFGGTWYNSSKIASRETNGKPYVIIRNGQGNIESQGDKAIYEDINQDQASIYLTSDHKVDLNQANDKRKAWKDSPVKASDYKGAQIVFNANRIFINSKQDDIQLASKTSTGIVAGTSIGLDAKDYIGLDANKIYLGTKALKEKEPVLLGTTSTDWLSDLCSILDTYFSMTTGVTSPSNASLVGSASTTAKGQMTALKTKISTLKSKKVYTE